MKYTIQTYVIDTTSKTSQVSACSDACSPLQPIIDTLWLATTPYAKQYDYCSIQFDIFPADAPDCAACLQSQARNVILENFLNIMNGACVSQLLAQNGDLVDLPRPLLDTVTVASTRTSSAKSSASAAVSLSSSVEGGASTATSTRTGTARRLGAPRLHLQQQPPQALLPPLLFREAEVSAAAPPPASAWALVSLALRRSRG
jgi:hypothetical protein